MKAEIIAEIGSNWEGNLTTARKIIRECKEAGADGVKFQMWRASDLYEKAHPNWNIISKSEVTFEKAEKLKIISDEHGIEFFCSAFYPEAINYLEKLKVKRYKIASRTCLFKDPGTTETLEATAHTKKPVLISMGMGGNKQKISKIFSKNKKIFCFCISEYPLKFKKIDWKLARKFDGFSDHTMGILAPITFSIFKKQMKTKKIYIEKHVKLENSKGPDASTSINTKQFKDMIQNIRLIENSTF